MFVFLVQVPVKKQIIFHCTKNLKFYLGKMVNSGPPIFSLRSSTCSFNVAKYSFILAFSILFCSHVYRSAPFNRILKSCLKQVVLCTQAPLGRC